MKIPAEFFSAPPMNNRTMRRLRALVRRLTNAEIIDAPAQLQRQGDFLHALATICRQEAERRHWHESSVEGEP